MTRRLAVMMCIIAPFAAGGVAAATRTDWKLPTDRTARAPISEPALSRIAHAPDDRRIWPSPHAVADAEKIAKSRKGLVSFAVIGPGESHVEFEADRVYAGASTVKAMLLVAELRRLDAAKAPVDAATQDTLEAMITYSDNAAADVIYTRVGDEGMFGVARDAGMKNFTEAGHWGNAQITAGDMAKLMSKLDNLLEDVDHRELADRLLTSIIPEQTWGIPLAAPEEALVRFKGGWLPHESGQLVHQIANVEVGRVTYSLAILTDAGPSMKYGEETIRLVANELLKTDRAGDRPGARSGSVSTAPSHRHRRGRSRP